MVHHSQYGDGPANPSRQSHPKGHSQSFTAGSNPNSAPMPTFSQQRRRPSHSSTASRSYTPQPEPTFDLMSSTQPMFGDVNFHSQMSFDLQASMSIANGNATTNSDYHSSAPQPSAAYHDDAYDASADFHVPDGLPEYDPHAFSADFNPAPDNDASYSRSDAMPPPADATLDSPFTANAPRLEPPTSNHQPALTDSIHKNQPQTPRKNTKARTARSQSLLPAPAGIKTPLGQRDANARPSKRSGPDSPSVDHTSPRKALKRSKIDEPGRHRDLLVIPDAEQFPPVDPGEDSAKPPYTYAQMIALAIWKGKDRRRTLSQIYDFIRTTWSYYQKDDTWENSIRHNLSLHKKFFEKKAREKDDPGKGNYWLIIPGNERELLEVYLKERPGHELSRNMGIMSTSRLEASALPPPMSYQEPMLPPQIPHFPPPFPQMSEQQPVALMRPHQTSDATIPASDAFDETDFADGPPNFGHLDGALTSSPPDISRRAPGPSDTPTRHDRRGSSVRTSGKRKRYSMGVDSGYMTGQSSILRYGQRDSVFSSEGDPEFQGGGRAEDAIRRIRASSPIDSPSKDRAALMLPPSSPFGKGSPLQYRASPAKMPISAVHKTPARTRQILDGAPSLPPPKANSKFNNSPIRQHDKLRANVRSMLQTPECIKNYPGRRAHRQDFDSFAIFEDTPSGAELESPLPANSAGRLLDEFQRNQKTPQIASSPYKPFPIYSRGDENASWAYDSPSKMLNTTGKFLSPSRYVPQTAKSVRFDPENWIIDENGHDGLPHTDDNHVDLGSFESFDDGGALDLTQSFRSIGERPVGLEPYGPATATLHPYG